MEPFFEEVKRRLAARAVRDFSLPGVSLRESAVLAPLFLRDGAPYVLLTKRPSNLRSHAGQISFPGGGRDEADPTPLHTALRETEEELGIGPAQVEVLGRLDEIPTVTGYRIVPFVGRIAPTTVYQPNPAEIDVVIEAPLRGLMDPSRRRSEFWQYQEREYEVYFYTHESHTIWGATAAMLKTLLDLIGDLPELSR